MNAHNEKRLFAHVIEVHYNSDGSIDDTFRVGAAYTVKGSRQLEIVMERMLGSETFYLEPVEQAVRARKSARRRAHHAQLPKDPL